MRAVALWSVVLLGVAACVRSPLPGLEVVATVDGEEILYTDFERHVSESVGEPAAGLQSAVLSRLLDRYLEERALALLAQERGIEGGGRQAIDRLLQGELAAAPSDDELGDYYEGHPQEFVRPHQVHVLQLLVEDRSIAEQARGEIAEGAEFLEVSSRYTADPGSIDQGLLDPLDLPPAFAEALESLEPGAISEIIATDYGFHLFQVVEVEEERRLSFDEARILIVERLERERSDQALGRLVREALDRYDLAIHERNLPFDYVPPTPS